MLKIKTQIPAKAVRRDNKIIITTPDGDKQTIIIPGMEESPCLARFKKHPRYKTARHQANAIARNRWDSIWWQRQYLLHNGTCLGNHCLTLRDYITLRLLLEYHPPPAKANAKANAKAPFPLKNNDFPTPSPPPRPTQNKPP